MAGVGDGGWGRTVLKCEQCERGRGGCGMSTSPSTVPHQALGIWACCWEGLEAWASREQTWSQALSFSTTSLREWLSGWDCTHRERRAVSSQLLQLLNQLTTLVCLWNSLRCHTNGCLLLWIQMFGLQGWAEAQGEDTLSHLLTDQSLTDSSCDSHLGLSTQPIRVFMSTRKTGSPVTPTSSTPRKWAATDATVFGSHESQLLETSSHTAR